MMNESFMRILCESVVVAFVLDVILVGVAWFLISRARR